jgi:5-methylcytosine-specific restriction endonuclease McrA
MTQKFNGKTDASTIAGRIRELGHATYAEYLAGEHWQAIRRRYLASDLPQRCACGAARHALHHKTYERLGRELLTDLEPICDRCHRTRHRKPKRPPSKRGPKRRKPRVSTAERRRAGAAAALSEWRELGR